MRAIGPEDPPRMTLRVYRVDRYGTCVAEVSSCEVRAQERPPEFNAMGFPPCACPRCHAEPNKSGLSRCFPT
jgi:hypothetical protein